MKKSERDLSIKKHNILIVRSDRFHLISNDCSCDLFTMEDMFGDLKKGETLIKDILLHGNININEKFYNQKLKNVAADVIIIFDAHVRVQFLKWILGNNSDKRIILWLWNTIEEIGNHIPLKEVPDEIEIWSYSLYDCRKYGLIYNTTFYPYSIDCNLKSTKYDVCFIGKDKGRLNHIMEIKTAIEDIGLITHFHISPTHFYELWRHSVYKKRISYNQVDEIISESKCILDCEVSNTAGLTMRPLEALYKQKKLITDKKNIIKEDFYCKDNIFIWGYDDISRLKYFVRSPYVKLPEKVYQKYTMKAWVNRFLNEDRNG